MTAQTRQACSRQVESLFDCLFLIKELHKYLPFSHSMSYEAAIDAGAFGVGRQMMCLRAPAVLSSQGLAGDDEVRIGHAEPCDAEIYATGGLAADVLECRSASRAGNPGFTGYGNAAASSGYAASWCIAGHACK